MAEIIDFIRLSQTTSAGVKAYHQDRAIGHSTLVNFETNGPTVLKPDYKVPITEAMQFGSLVDTLLTRPYDFQKEYYVANTEDSLSPSEERLVDYFVTENRFPDYLTKEELISVMDTCRFYATMTKNVEGRIQKALDLRPVIEERINSKNKIIITKQQLNDASNCIQSLKTSDITKKIFKNKDCLFYQTMFFTSLEDISIKCMFDFLYIDYKAKEIHPFDLKCVSYPERDFIKNSFYKFKYYREAEMYMFILKRVLAPYTYDTPWKIMPFKFVVINKVTLSPIIYEFPIVYKNDQLQISKNGFVDKFSTVLRKMQWHIQNQQFVYDKETYLKIFKQSKDTTSDFITTPIFEKQDIQETSEPEEMVVNTETPKKLITSPFNIHQINLDLNELYTSPFFSTIEEHIDNTTAYTINS